MKRKRTMIGGWLLLLAAVALVVGSVYGQNGNTPGPQISLNNEDESCVNTSKKKCETCCDESTTECVEGESGDCCDSPSGVNLSYAEGFAFIDDDGPHASPTGSFCASCGATGIPQNSQLPRVRLRRIWRSTFSMRVGGSFGTTMFSSYDYSVRLGTLNGSLVIEFKDPNYGTVEMFRQEVINGEPVFTPISPEDFFTRVDEPATEPTTTPGSHITLVKLDGQKLNFEWTGFTDNDAYTYARLLSVEDRNGNEIRFEYVEPVTNDTRAAFMWATATDPYGRILRFKYISWRGRNVLSEVDLPDGRKVSYQYDSSINSLFAHKVEYGGGIESTWTFDRVTGLGVRNEALMEADHHKQTIQESLITFGRVRSIKRGDGTTQYSRTDVNGTDGTIVTTTIYNKGETFEFVSSDSKPLISMRQQKTDGSFEELTRYAADSHRPVTGIEQPDGRIWDAERDDSNDQLKSRKYPDGSTESFTYNQFAQMTSHTHRSGAIEKWTYDPSGNLLKHTEAAGVAGVRATEKWTYNSLGQVLTHTDFRGNVTAYEYYTNGDLQKIVLPSGAGQPAGAISYVYDTAGRVASVEDPVGRTVNFEYDSAGRLIKTTYGVGTPDESTEKMIYDTGQFSARMKFRNDRNGNLTVYSYDNTGRALTERVRECGAITDLDLCAANGAVLSTLTNTWDAPTGRLMAVNRDGDSTEYTYDYKGRVLTTTVFPKEPKQDHKLKTTNVYDQYHLISTEDPYGRQTFYLYDLLDHVTRKIRETIPEAIANGTNLELLSRHPGPNAPYLIEEFKYDTQERRTDYIDGRGVVYKYEYDARDRRILERSAVGTPVEAIEKYTYDRNNNLLSRKDKNNHVWKRTYTARNNILTDANPLLQKTRYTYYPDGLAETMTNPNNHTTKYVYDTCCGLESGGRLIQLIDADLKVKNFDYDPNGNRTMLTDEIGRVITYDFDGLNRLIRTSVDPGGLNLQTTMAYNQTPGVAGRTETITSPADQDVTNNYDGLNRISTVDGETPHITYTYDVIEGGFLKTKITDANGNSRSNLTDGAGRTIKMFDGLNHATQMSYDNNSNLTLVIDRDLRRTKYNYDERNRRTNMIADEGAGGINANTLYEYDPAGNLLGITDAEGKVTKYTYDNADRRLTATYAFGTAEAKVWIYAYHPLGQLRQINKPNEIEIKFAYDKPERLSTRTYRKKNPNGTFMNLGVDTFTYHANSLLKTAVGGLYNTTVDRSNLAADYDGANRLLQERQNIGAGPKPISYTYHPDDLVNQITYPGGTTVQQAYTNRRELFEVKINGVVQARHTYDPAGRRASRNYVPNGRTTNWTYDSDDRITRLNHVNVQRWDYRYTDEGDALVQDDRTTVNKGEAYKYDGMHRLIDHKRGQVVGNTVPTPPPAAFLQGWTLDKAGNWTAWNDNGVAEDRKHNNHHALTERKRNNVPLPQAYDPNLNQTDDGVSFLFEYDANEMLKRVRDRSFPNSVIAEYRYDALGRRVEKFLPGVPDNITVRYYYSGERIIEERDGGNPGVDKVLATYTYGDYIDEPLTMDRDLNNSGAFEANERFYYHSNRMYSTYALTNSSGSIVERYVYSPYGEVTTFNAAYQLNPNPLMSRVGNPFTFTGRELDAETGLMHYRARTYDTIQGRFKQRDQIEYDGGDTNLYAYVHGTPMKFMDPFGLAPGDWWDPRSYTAAGRELNPFNPSGSFSKAAVSISDALGGLLAGDLNQVADAYDQSLLGQTAQYKNSSDCFNCLVGYLGTRSALGLSAAATATAAGLIGARALGVPGLEGGWRAVGNNWRLIMRDPKTAIKNIGYDARKGGYDAVRQQYWRVSKGANGNSLQHLWFQNQTKWVPEGFRNAGFNFLEVPKSLNSWMAGINAREWGFRGAVSSLMAGDAIGSYKLGKAIKACICACK